MTKLLEETINKLKNLSEEDQNSIAEIINDEILWGVKFNNSQDKLSLLAEEARKEFKENKTKNHF